MRFFVGVFFVVISLLTAGLVGAENKADVMLKNLMAKSGVQKQIAETVVAQQKALFPACLPKKFGPKSISREEFNVKTSKENIDVVAHHLIVELTDCNDKVFTRRVAVIERPDGKVRVMPLVPGETIAGIKLQLDLAVMQPPLFMSLKRKAGAAYDKCRTLVITDSKVTKKLSDEEWPSWQEMWSARLCGDSFTQTVDFKTNSEGVAFALPVE